MTLLVGDLTRFGNDHHEPELLLSLVGVTVRPAPLVLAEVVLAAGVLDMVAKQQGLLSLVVVLVSLYPASTLLLARHVLGGRLHAIQVTGSPARWAQSR